MSIGQALHLENSYRSLPEAFYAQVVPTPVASPRVFILNEALAEELGTSVLELSREEQAQLFSGNQLPTQATPLAQAYAGHQFGHFTMLGDGRAHLLGELVTPTGKRVDIQFKGSGPTPYSRRGDGRAVLGPMLREYLISEAMAALGIPTTRSLAVVSTGEQVRRETFQQGAVLTRVASSHLRVGTFQYAAATQDRSLLEALLDYTIMRHDPELIEAENKALALLDAVIARQAELIVHWMRVGFIHGVMNTDNMALSGETIDYGPCAFMDAYDPGTVFSSIDHAGRYAYANQPSIAQWNLTRFAESLLPLIDDNTDKAIELAEASLNRFAPIYQQQWLDMMRAKLGLPGSEDADLTLITDLLGLMQNSNADFTNTFRDLGQEKFPESPLYQQSDFTAWHKRWQARREQYAGGLDASAQLMRQTNPAVIPRNHKVEEALEAADRGDAEPMKQLLAALSEPYADRPGLAAYQTPPEPGACAYQTFCGT